jgi:hypothetical protein
MMRFFQGILLLMALLLMASCYGPYYFNDDGKTVHLPGGIPFEINLEESENDGFDWYIRYVDSTIVYPTLKPLMGNLDGEEGTRLRTFYFQTVGEGETTIHMVYSKKGMQDIIKDFRLTVKAGS